MQYITLFNSVISEATVSAKRSISLGFLGICWSDNNNRRAWVSATMEGLDINRRGV